jgi:hypothetical protein
VTESQDRWDERHLRARSGYGVLSAAPKGVFSRGIAARLKACPDTKQTDSIRTKSVRIRVWLQPYHTSHRKSGASAPAERWISLPDARTERFPSAAKADAQNRRYRSAEALRRPKSRALNTKRSIPTANTPDLHLRLRRGPCLRTCGIRKRSRQPPNMRRGATRLNRL